jgi:hypothetical protein
MANTYNTDRLRDSGERRPGPGLRSKNRWTWILLAVAAVLIAFWAMSRRSDDAEPGFERGYERGVPGERAVPDQPAPR